MDIALRTPSKKKRNQKADYGEKTKVEEEKVTLILTRNNVEQRLTIKKSALENIMRKHKDFKPRLA